MSTLSGLSVCPERLMNWVCVILDGDFLSFSLSQWDEPGQQVEADSGVLERQTADENNAKNTLSKKPEALDIKGLPVSQKMERARRFERPTPTLARTCPIPPNVLSLIEVMGIPEIDMARFWAFLLQLDGNLPEIVSLFLTLPEDQRAAFLTLARPFLRQHDNQNLASGSDRNQTEGVHHG